MPKSLRCKLSDLRYKRLITDEEYQEMIKKLNGHDREIRNKAIDEFAKAMKAMCHGITMAEKHIDNVAEQLKGE